MLANTFHKLKYNIGGCRSPNFTKDCIESTIHGLLSMTKGAGKRSWWPEINPEVSNVVTPGQFAIINCWYITAFHAKTGTEANTWGFLWIDSSFALIRHFSSSRMVTKIWHYSKHDPTRPDPTRPMDACMDPTHDCVTNFVSEPFIRPMYMRTSPVKISKRGMSSTQWSLLPVPNFLCFYKLTH